MLAVEDDVIKSQIWYHISISVRGRVFSMNDATSDASFALSLVKDLRSRGYHPEISRVIVYDRDKSGYLVKESENEDLTFERLEEIVFSNEPSPILNIPHIVHLPGNSR